MASRKVHRGQISLAALTLLLAACGGGSTSGGGLVTTPAPAPSPSPTPGPTPTPTPSPTGDLTTTSQQDFTADAAVQQASVPLDGSGPTGSTGFGGSLDVHLVDAEYTLTSGTNSLQFDGSDIIRTSPDEISYQLVNGDTTDTIVAIPLPSQNSGSIFRYLNGGYWTRSIAGSTALDSTTTAFVFGLETPDSGVPRTGSAGYRTTLSGNLALAGQPDPFAIIGNGALVVDLATGKLTFDAGLRLRRSDYFIVESPTIYSAVMHGTGTVASSENTFSGNLGVTGVAELNGGFSGRFYGPGLEEVGAVFYAEGPDASAVGTIAGVRDNAIPSKSTLETLTNPTSIYGGINALAYGEGAAGEAKLIDQVTANVSPVVEYSPSTQTYTFKAIPGFFDYYGDGSLVAGPAQRAAAQDRPDFLLYDTNSETSVAIFDGEVGGVKLSYASFAEITSNRTDVVDGVGGYIAFLPFGLRTLPGQLPLTGSASYSGEIFGIANSTGYNADFVRRLAYTLGGTSNFNVDFATFAFTGSLSPIGTSIDDGSTRDFGVFTVDGSIGTLQYLVEAEINGQPGASFHGMFYGPNAGEFAAFFSASTPDQLYALEGVTLATQD